jgi:hypothetical protein
VDLGDEAREELKVTVIKQIIIGKIRERFMLPPLYALIFGFYITTTKRFLQGLLRQCKVFYLTQVGDLKTDLLIVYNKSFTDAFRPVFAFPPIYKSALTFGFSTIDLNTKTYKSLFYRGFYSSAKIPKTKASCRRPCSDTMR